MRTTAVLLFVVLVAGCNRNDSEPAQPVASLSKETPQLQSPVTLPARFSSWSLSCEGTQDVKDLTSKRCAISQIVTTNPKSAKVLLGVTVDYRDSPSVPTIHFRFSPTARVAPGIGIKIDELAEMRLPISDCNAQRCEASGRLVPDVLKLWQSGRLAQVAFIAENDKQVTLPVSLDGFPMAIAALNEQYRAVR
jgi:invasion protein IalB